MKKSICTQPIINSAKMFAIRDTNSTMENKA